MKKLILLVGLLTLVAFVSGAIAAAPPKETTAPATVAPAVTKTVPPTKLEKFGGKIKSVDAVAKSVVVAKGKDEKNFMVTADTKITKGKETLKFEDLKAGMNVSIEYNKDGDKNVAVAIKVAEAKKK
jgi:Cu/Ag efflux protein CusF